MVYGANRRSGAEIDGEDEMTDTTLLAQVLDSFADPVFVADTEHTVI